MKHAISFLRSPIGYVLNALVSLPYLCDCELPYWLFASCDLFCLKDGIQDEPISFGRW